MAGVAKITLVLRFMKSSKFYYVQTAKVINSKKMLAVKGSNFVHSEEFSPHFSNSIFLVISPYKWNQRINWRCFQQFWLNWLCFGFVSFVFILDIYFSRKILVLINLTVIFPEKFAVTSVINIYSSGNYSCTWIMIICIFD